MSQENVPKTEEDLLSEKIKDYIRKLDEIKDKKSYIEQGMRITDFTTLPSEEIDRMADEQDQIESQYIELQRKFTEALRRSAEIKRKK